MKIFTAILIAFVLLAAARAEVLGQDRGGGDDIGLEVSATLSTALANFRNMPVSQAINLAAIEKKLESVKIVIVDQALPITIKDKIQDGVAANSPSENIIAVNRTRWQSISSPHAKEGIMIHEALSLAGLESTGYYPYSGEYLRAFALSPLTLVKGNTDEEKVPVVPAISYRKVMVETIRTYIDTGVGAGQTEMDQHMEPESAVTFYDEYKDKIFSLQLLHRQPDRQDASEFTISITTNGPWQQGTKNIQKFSKAFRFIDGAFETETSQAEQVISLLPGSGYFVHAAEDHQPNNLNNYDSYFFEHYYADGTSFQSVLYPFVHIDAGSWLKKPAPPGRVFLSAVQANYARGPIRESEFVSELTKGQRQAMDDFKDLFTRSLQLGKSWKDCVTAGQASCDDAKAAYEQIDNEREKTFLNWIKVSELRIPRKKYKPKPTPKPNGGSEIVRGGYTPGKIIYDPGHPPTVGGACYTDATGTIYCPFPGNR